jgi:carbamate kinase
MLVVLALGGNALLRRGQPMDLEVQRRNLINAIKAIAPIARTHQVVITHGNGPQIGLLALQAHAGARPYPLDVLGAETEGMIGYLIEQELANALPDREIATLLTQVEVDPNDSAFATPSKPIGPIYQQADAQMLAAELGWTLTPDGPGYRRTVPSPAPQRIREIASVKLLLRAGVIVICAGGGGIPVVATAGGAFGGVEAVVDKDLTAALIAREIAADALLLLTDVAAVWTKWPMREGQPIGRTTPAALRGMTFAAGTMGPKVAAACRFVEGTGRIAAIGAIEHAGDILAGHAGTIVQPDR